MRLSDSTQKQARPFLKWVGGKTRLIPQFSAFLPPTYETYIEPFLGGGALFFYLHPKKAYINDINKTLIYSYQVIKSKPKMLCRELCKLSDEYLILDHDRRKEYFYSRRDEFNQLTSLNTRKAVLMIFLNKSCFNGMYRENSLGKFNVPFGDYKNPKICDSNNLLLVSEMLETVELSSTDFITAVNKAKRGDFVYFDPPYYPLSTTSNFTSYSQGSFNANDQETLRDLFVELDKRGCYVMLSNSSSDFIKELYKSYRQEVVLAGRSINSKGGGRGKINELVVLNY